MNTPSWLLTLSARPESRIERSRGGKALNDRERISEVRGIDCGDNLAVALDRDLGALARTGALAHRNERSAVSASEAGIERAVGIISSKCEVLDGGSHSDDLPVALERKVIELIAAPGAAGQGRRGAPVTVEGDVERAVGVKARDAEMAVCISAGENLAVGLLREGVGGGRRCAAIETGGFRYAGAVKPCVELAG